MFDLSCFAQQSVIITGGSNGIGACIAKLLTDYGATVIIIDLKAPVDPALSGAHFIQCDLTDERCISGVFQHEYLVDNPCYCLINTARGSRGVAPLKEDSSSLDEGLAVSLKAPLLLSQSFIISTHQDNRAKHGRAIVNISSICAQFIAKESASYHLAKSGVESMTRYLAVYGGKYGVRVNAVAPGFIVPDVYQQRFWAEDNGVYRDKANRAHPLNRIGSEMDVANAVLFLASSASAFITGQTVAVDGGLNLRDGWCQLADFEEAGL